jgi:hypothetical protein
MNRDFFAGLVLAVGFLWSVDVQLVCVAFK